MRLALVLAFLLVLAGCGARPAPAVPDVYLEDASGDADARYDIVRANFTELNGSLVLRIQIRNFADGLPLVEADVATSLGDFYARLVLDPSKPTPPKVRAEQGALVGDERRQGATTCWFPSFPSDPDSSEPWWIFLEFLNNRTGFERESGGVVHSLSIVTTDETGAIKDEAERKADFRTTGGPNPYGEDCPMDHERRRLF